MRSPNPGLRWRWELLLAALPCAASLAAVAFRLAGPTSYRDFLAGQLTYLDLSDRPSYWAVLAFPLGYAAALAVLTALAGRLSRRLGATAMEGFLQLLGYGCLPMVIWLGSLALDSDPRFEAVHLSSALVVSIAVFYALAAHLRPAATGDEITTWVGVSGLSPFLAAMGGVAAMVAFSRLATHRWVPEHQSTRTLALALSLLSLVWLLAAWSRIRSAEHALGPRLRHVLVAVQAIFPLGFFALIPTPWNEDGIVRQAFEISPALYALIGLAMAAAWLDLARRAARGAPMDPLSAVSPGCLSAILVLWRLPMVTLPASLGADDYHLGEKILPWWQWRDFGLVPFVDFSPVHGFIDVLYGLAGDLFFGGTAASFAPAVNVITAACFVLLLLGLNTVLGPLPAFFFALLAPAKGHVYFALVAALCLLLAPGLLENRRKWLATWVAGGTLLVLFAPGQSAAFVMATLPFGLWMAYRAFREDRAGLLRLTGIGAAVAAVIALATPWGRILLGTIRFGIESAAVNSVAFAKSWMLVDEAGVPAAPGIWEVARVAWIGVAVVALLALPSALRDPSPERRRRRLLLVSTILLFLILLVPYSMGRNPTGKMARSGLVSGVALSALLPLLVLSFPKARPRHRVLVFLALAAALLVPEQSRAILRPLKLLRLPAKLFSPPPNIVGGAAIGLPRLGMAPLTKVEIERLTSLRDHLEAWLEPGETYLDLTNRNAQYFYLGYPAPMESAAFFNLVHPAQQRRSLARLEADPPPVILLWADGVMMKQMLPLRAHLLYRWVVELDYTPVVRRHLTFLVRPDRLRPEDGRFPDAIRARAYDGSGYRNGVRTPPEAEFVASDPRDVLALAPGDQVTLAHSGSRQVRRVAHDRVVLEGPPLDPELDGPPARIRIHRASPVRAQELAILQSALLRRHLRFLPLSWGRSAPQLESRMIPGLDLAGHPEIVLRGGAEPVEGGGHRLSGESSAVRFVLARERPPGDELGLLRLDVECGTFSPPEEVEDRESDEAELVETELDVTWRSESREPKGTVGVGFLARPGEHIVPLDAAPGWIRAEGIYWLQVELVRAGACAEPVVSRVRLAGRRL